MDGRRMPPLRHEPADERGDHRLRFTAGARAGTARGTQFPPAERSGGGSAARMAGRVRAAHHDVVVYNRTPERARPLEQRGAKVAATAKQLAAGVDIVLSS